MVKISIHGSCVSRDIFRFDSKNDFEVVNYIGRNSIISLSYPSVALPAFEKIGNGQELNWDERMIYYDCKKIALDKIVTDGCDYLIIDLIDERFGILESDKGCLTYSQVLQRSEHINEVGTYFIKDVKEDSEEFYNAYKKYALWLRDNFEVDRIIIHEVYPVLTYLGNDNNLHVFDSNDIRKCKSLCSRIEKGYKLLESFLPEAEVLRMPYNVMAFENHKWGKATVHYVDDYYIEMLSRIGEIVNNKREVSKRYISMNSIYSPYYSQDKYIWNVEVDKEIINQKSVCLDYIKYGDLSHQHRFYVEKHGYHFEIFLYKKNIPKLYVILGGERTSNGKEREIPYFNRWTYYGFLDGSLLVIEDPMFYKYSELLLGWFYGTEDENGCRDGLVELIKEFLAMLNITNDNLQFFSSSGGGTVAIYLASKFEGSTAITINPQIDLASWNYANQFSVVTGVNLHKQDCWSRNNIVNQIKGAKKSNFVICINMESDSDRRQLDSFAEKYNCRPSFGLNKFGNLIIWEYKVKSLMLHTAFETRELFWAISYLGDILKKGINLNLYKEIYTLLGDLWGDIWNLQTKVKHLSEKNTCLDLMMPEVEEIIIDNQFQNGFKFKSVDSNFQYVKILEKLDKGIIYKINIEIADNFIPYELAIYDFSKKKYINRKQVDESCIKFMLVTNYEECVDCALLLYNGMIGNTRHNCMWVSKVQVSIIASEGSGFL